MFKHYNIWYHYQTQHGAKYKNLQGNLGTEKINELEVLKKQWKPVDELQDTEWLQDLAFMVDITDHLNNLNKMMQGCHKFSHSIIMTAYTFFSWSWVCGRCSPQMVTPFFFPFYETCTPLTNINRTKLHSRLAHKHLNDILKLAFGTFRDLAHTFDAAAWAKRCQVSGAS